MPALSVIGEAAPAVAGAEFKIPENGFEPLRAAALVAFFVRVHPTVIGGGKWPAVKKFELKLDALLYGRSISL